MPSPKFQAYEVIVTPGSGSEALPLKLTGAPGTGAVGERLKDAVGGVYTVTCCGPLVFVRPLLSSTVTVIV